MTFTYKRKKLEIEEDQADKYKSLGVSISLIYYTPPVPVPCGSDRLHHQYLKRDSICMARMIWIKLVCSQALTRERGFGKQHMIAEWK